MALQVEKKRPPAAEGHTLQQKDRDPLKVEVSFGDRSSEGVGPVAGKAAQVLRPRLVSGRDLNVS